MDYDVNKKVLLNIEKGLKVKKNNNRTIITNVLKPLAELKVMKRKVTVE